MADASRPISSLLMMSVHPRTPPPVLVAMFDRRSGAIADFGSGFVNDCLCFAQCAVGALCGGDAESARALRATTCLQLLHDSVAAPYVTLCDSSGGPAPVAAAAAPQNVAATKELTLRLMLREAARCFKDVPVEEMAIAAVCRVLNIALAVSCVNPQVAASQMNWQLFNPPGESSAAQGRGAAGAAAAEWAFTATHD